MNTAVRKQEPRRGEGATRRREHVAWSNKPEVNEGGARYFFKLLARDVELVRQIKDIFGGPKGDGLGAVSTALILKRALRVYRAYLETARLDTLDERRALTDAKEGR